MRFTGNGIATGIEDGCVVVGFVSGGAVKVEAGFTPEAARELGGKLIELAGEAESESARRRVVQ